MRSSSAGPGSVEHPIVSRPELSRFWTAPAGVSSMEPALASQGVTHPRGFLASGVTAGLKGSGRPDMGVVAVAGQYRDQAVSAAVFTTNAFAAAPVIVSRSECALDRLVAVAMNSGNANACTGERGLMAARATQEACAEALGVPVARVGVASTGVIGAPVDQDKAVAGVKMAAEALSPAGGPAFAEAIVTTDRFLKLAALDLRTAQGLIRLGVCAKGAGMIAPAMATMLCVVTTDACLDGGEAEILLHSAVTRTFNCISVDGEMSTNDCVFFLASGASGVRLDGRNRAEFLAALEALLLRVALMMVADGEGASKIMRVTVLGAENREQARSVARAVADSPLVKTAMHGSDPNWGRIMGAAGACLAGRSLPEARLLLCGVPVVEKAAARALGADELSLLASGMKESEIDIELNLGLGDGSAEIYFADMGHEYISINAEYHT